MRRSHSTAVSRWFVMPIARRSPGAMPASATASAAAPSTAAPDRVRILLHEARLGEERLERAPAAAAHRERLVDDQAGRARRALVDRENHWAIITREVIPALPVGHGVLEVARNGGRSLVVGRHAASPLRLLCPRNAGTAAWTYTSSFGGGLVDGDDVRLDVPVGAGAQALVATQASTKAYPADGGARQTIIAHVADDGLLVLLSDPLVPFAGARVESLVDVSLAAGASLVAVEALAAGRVARGERWQAARCQTRVRVRRDGRAARRRRTAARSRPTATSPAGWGRSTSSAPSS